MGEKPVILLTNDDGIEATGLQALARALAGVGQVVVVAPRKEQSASSHSLTLRSSIAVERAAPDRFVVDGTPTDCVLLGIQTLLATEPDLVVSGVNHGPNMGEDVTYSGTVAAAVEGTILGVGSIAVSCLQRSLEDAAEISRLAAAIIATALAYGIPPQTLLNVNIPDPRVGPIRGVSITKLGSRAYENAVRVEAREGKSTLYRLGGQGPIWKDEDGTDIAAVRGGRISITPLHLDLTDYKAMVAMERWSFPV